MVPNVLSIAGFDPSGGAGVLADIKTFAALRCYGVAAITAVTAQNTQGVATVHILPSEFVGAEIDALLTDSEIAAVKIGMLATPAIVETVAQKLANSTAPLVLDPVLEASSGDPLAAGDVMRAISELLAPLVTLVTPNVAEAGRLAGAPMPTNIEDMQRLAEQWHRRGFKSVLVTGGDMCAASADDVLFDGTSQQIFSAPRIATRNTHGTGCTLSSAIAAYLARGSHMIEAIQAAKAYVAGALALADDLTVGRGPGPLQHFHRFW